MKKSKITLLDVSLVQQRRVLCVISKTKCLAQQLSLKKFPGHSIEINSPNRFQMTL